MRGAAPLVVVLLAARVASADPPTDRSREVHGIVLGAAGATYLTVEFVFKARLAPLHCRICEPTGFDIKASRALIWDNTKAANVISTAIGYAGAPMYALGMLVAATYDQHSGRRWIDDSIPVLESAIAVGLFHHVVKFTVGRQRPFVHYAGHAFDTDDNASLFSGHTGLAFAVATSAGVIAHYRQYSTEPYIWSGGAILAVATGYLRIAADRHWATDVLIGAGVGIGFGLLIPATFHSGILHPDPTTAPRRETPYLINLLGGQF